MTSSQFLDECIDKNKRFLDAAVQAVRDLPVDKLNRRTVNGEWSPAQVFKHMVLANTPYEPLVVKALASLPLDSTNQQVQNTWFGSMLGKFAGPTKNVSPPKQMIPGDDQFPASVVQEWAAQQQRLIGLMESAKGKDLNKKCMKNPFMPLFGMNLADCFLVFTEHTDRHVRQIEERAAGSC